MKRKLLVGMVGGSGDASIGATHPQANRDLKMTDACQSPLQRERIDFRTPRYQRIDD
jgi:hypothetical protein